MLLLLLRLCCFIQTYFDGRDAYNHTTSFRRPAGLSGAGSRRTTDIPGPMGFVMQQQRNHVTPFPQSSPNRTHRLSKLLLLLLPTV
jgi:hypothetical protein